MDLRAEVDRALEEMEWGDVVITLTAAINELLYGTANSPSPSSPPPPPAPVSAGLEANTQPQPAESQDGGYGDCIPVGADHHMFEEQNPFMAAPTISNGPLHREDIMQPGQMYGDAGACCQGQYQPYLQSVENVPTAAGVSHPAAAVAAAPKPFTNGPVIQLAEGQRLCCVGVLNGQLVYEVIAKDAAAPVCAAPPQNTSNSKKRKRNSQQDDERPYVKKPPNAFMLFLKEQRANVKAEVERGSAAVNTILGERWRSLTKEQQAKYYNQAEKERLLHSQQHPEWSTRDNYGKKRKRQRGMASRLDSLKTLSTSLTSPLAPTETQSPPTERMLEERCHPTTVRLCRSHMDTLTANLNQMLKTYYLCNMFFFYLISKMCAACSVVYYLISYAFLFFF